MSTSTRKIVAGLLGFAMVLTMVVGLAAVPAGAETVDFTRNLTVGSRGADVTQLQTILQAKGFFTVEPTGYFGAITKRAVAAWQASVGITPAAGYFGPISRGQIGGTTGGTASVPGCPTGAVYNYLTGALCSGSTPASTTPGVITTPGVEGVLTVEKNPTPAGVTAREGQTNVPLMGVKVKAQKSDLRVERIKLDLGTATSVYTKVFKKLSVTDEAGTVVGSVSLDSTTVLKDGTTYYVNITGMNYVVPKDTTKVLTINGDLYSSIDSGDRTSRTIQLDTNGIRTVDGVGINQYGPASDLTAQTITIAAELSDNAALKVSASATTPVAQEVLATEGSSSNEKDGLTLLNFNLAAEKDSVKITQVVASVVDSGSTASAATAYLYDGSTPIGSGTVSSDSVTFSNLDFTIPADTTKVLSLKVDIDSAVAAATNFYGSISGSNITAENSSGSAVVPTGTATGDTLVVRNQGLEISLVGTPTLVKSATPEQSNVSTSTALATFTLRLKAVGDDIYFGTVSSGTPAFSTTTTHFKVYRDGAALTAANLLAASSTDFSAPTGTITSGIGTNSFELQQNNTVDIPVTFRFEGRLATSALVTGGSYAVQLEGVTWSADAGATSVTSTFMSGKSAWRTGAVSMP